MAIDACSIPPMPCLTLPRRLTGALRSLGSTICAGASARKRPKSILAFGCGCGAGLGTMFAMHCYDSRSPEMITSSPRRARVPGAPPRHADC